MTTPTENTTTTDTSATTLPVAPVASAASTDGAAELAALKAQLAATATAVLAGVPEHLRSLIPASLSHADQIAWFNAAKATGVFEAKTAVPATDSGKPAITPTTPDPATLSVFARMAGGYRK